MLRYFEDLSSTEIAARENLPAGTVRGRLKTAIQLLHDALDAKYGARAIWIGPVGALAKPSEPAGAVASTRSPRPLARGARLASSTSWVVSAVVVTVGVGTASWIAHTRPERSHAIPQEAAGAGDAAHAPVFPQASSTTFPASASALSRRLVGASPQTNWFTGVVTVADTLGAKAWPLASVAIRIVKGAPHIAGRSEAALVVPIREHQISPSVRFAQPGQQLVIENGGTIPRTFRIAQGATSLFEQEIPPNGRAPAITAFATLEPLRVDTRESQSDKAFVVATDNPFHAFTNTDGRFVIDDPPPGTYTLEAWDAGLGSLRQEVTLPRRSPVAFSFVLGAVANSDGCKIGTRRAGPVGEACATGGIPGARRFMKILLKQARGMRANCEDCHRDLGSYALVPGARARYDSLLSQLEQR